MSTVTTAREGRTWQGWVGLVARLALAVTLLWASLSKITTLESSAAAVRAYKILPFDVANIVGYVLPVFELALGILLLLGLFTRVSAALSALLMIVFVCGIASVWVRGISIECGCFGGGGETDPASAFAKYPWEIARDLALAACGVWLMIRPATPASMDRWLHGTTTHS